MAQGILPFTYEEENKDSGMTALGGLPVSLDLAGGKLPSDDFGENGAWWWIMMLALNLHNMMKRLASGESWMSRRMKAIRFSLIHVPGRIVESSREMIIRLVKGSPASEFLIKARQRIMALCPVPSG